MEGWPERLTTFGMDPARAFPLCDMQTLTPETRAPEYPPEGRRRGRSYPLCLPGCISRSAGRPKDQRGGSLASPFECFGSFAGVSPTCCTPAHRGWSPSTVSGASTRRSYSSSEEDSEETPRPTRSPSAASLAGQPESSAASISPPCVKRAAEGDAQGLCSRGSSPSAAAQGRGVGGGDARDEGADCGSPRQAEFCKFVGDVNSHFVLLEKLGAGSQGVVYRSQLRRGPPPLGDADSPGEEGGGAEEVCLKFLVAETLAPSSVERLCRLRVPHVVRHHCAIHDCRGQWLLMDLARGPELLVLIRRKHQSGGGDESCKGRRCACGREARAVAEALDEAACKRYLVQMLEALAGLHAEGLIHGDVKAENFLLEEPLHLCHATSDEREKPRPLPSIVLSDLGSAVPRERAQRRPRGGRTMPPGEGTPMYMAPELFTKSSYDEKVDVWAAGIVFALLLAGRTPFDNTDVLSFLWRHCASSPCSSGACAFEPTSRRDVSCPLAFSKKAAGSCAPGASTSLLQQRGEGISAPLSPTLPPVREDGMAIFTNDFEDAADFAPLLDPLIDAEINQGEAWRDVSIEAKRMALKLLSVDPRARPSAAEALADPWLNTQHL
ncbi:putative protein kinase [Besnoitia besnoiti]|uniref:Protein kinase domain-containing protein n=1 Tax=Besnoitia besnoiti TaxID=94643 RepID=A0A2A9M629_BESBE|nr:putative protein kinase [Besnoitia besnoiti]PFH33399.1 putative protein kinase [Besnoitia besnoiti]